MYFFLKTPILLHGNEIHTKNQTKCTALQTQTAVTAHFERRQLLLYDCAEHYCFITPAWIGISTDYPSSRWFLAR